VEVGGYLGKLHQQNILVYLAPQGPMNPIYKQKYNIGGNFISSIPPSYLKKRLLNFLPEDMGTRNSKKKNP